MNRKSRKVSLFAMLFASIAILQVSVLAFPFGDKGDEILDTFGANGASEFVNMPLPELLGKLFQSFDVAKSAIEAGNLSQLSDVGVSFGKIGLILLEKSSMLEADKLESLKSSLTQLKELSTKIQGVSQSKDLSGAVELLNDCENVVKALKEVYPKDIIDEAMALLKK